MASGNAQIVSCPNCGARNRVDPHASGEAVCGKCKTPLTAPAHPVTVTDQNFTSTVGQSPLPVLLDLWAAWCGPCRMLAPTIEQLAAELSGKVLVAKLDVDANPATAARFRVQSIPTLLILRHGRELDRIVGVQPKQAILAKLQRHLT
jgi:thioredoxin 2